MKKRTAKIMLVSLATFMLVGCQADDAPKLAADNAPRAPLAKRPDFSASMQPARNGRGSVHRAGRNSPAR